MESNDYRISGSSSQILTITEPRLVEYQKLAANVATIEADLIT